MTLADDTHEYVREQAPPTMASPSWWGADSVRCRLVGGGDGRADRFVKTTADHARRYVDVESAFGFALAAGAAGVGPLVLEADVASGTLTMTDLTSTHRTASLADFADAFALERVAAARSAVHGLEAAHLRTASVFDDIRALVAGAGDAGAALPADLTWMLRFAKDAEQAISAEGVDLLPCHGDGNVSNTMVSERTGEVVLIDWDVAAVMDPLQDIGAVLAELRASDLDARELFELMWGRWDGALFDRARLYGIADAVRWGLIGAFADALAPGSQEYSKFSDWQFFRARMWLRERHVDDRLRNV